jgi:putative transposase
MHGSDEKSLDEHIVMPNHVHGIVIINEKQHTDVKVQGKDVRGRDVQLNVPTGNVNALNAPNTNANDKRRGTNNAMSPAKGSLSVVIRTFKAAVTT